MLTKPIRSLDGSWRIAKDAGRQPEKNQRQFLGGEKQEEYEEYEE